MLREKGSYIFTSESVSEGHPDKVCDQISDAILDLYLEKDPFSRVAIETLATTNQVVVAGEVSSSHPIHKNDIENTIRKTIKRIGYAQEQFHAEKVNVLNLIHAQSADIAQGVVQEGDIGAGDQGIMFGYATAETPSFMPAPLHYAHRILENLSKARHAGSIHGLGPDAKTQLSLYYKDGKPKHLDTLVLSTQHDHDLSIKEVTKKVMPVVEASLPKGWLTSHTKVYINPTGRFVIGGPDGDTGLTGRKIIVDTYGGAAPHGGGAFSGKDPTKVDRSAAYAARYLAKNIVATGLAKRCLIQLSYAIGIPNPLAIYVETYGTSCVPVEDLEACLHTLFHLSPKGIIEMLDLRKPFYEQTASYGHFGRTYDPVTGAFSWEKEDLSQKLKNYFGL